MSLRPGVAVISSAAPPAPGAAVDTGTWFVVGATEKGPVDEAVEVRGMNDYVRVFGARQVGTAIYSLSDYLETFFREGGVRAYVARPSAAAAVAASSNLADASAGTSLKVAAKNPGLWGNSLSRTVLAGVTAGTFIIVITHSTLGEVDRSPELADQAVATTWESDWVAVTIPGGASALDPAPSGPTALTSGANADPTDTERQAALALFTRDLGPGQVSIPGTVSSGNRTALFTHAAACNRHALLDPTDIQTKSTLVTEGKGLQASSHEFGSIAGAPWVKIPNPTITNTKRTPVAPSAFVAALFARNDARFSPNEPSAGFRDDKGVSRYVIDLTQPTPWTDSERDELNTAGVNVIRNYRGRIVRYGARTLGDPTGPWAGEGNQRLRMKITAQAELIAEGFLFRQIDGKGTTLADFKGTLRAMLLKHYADGSVFGATADEAFLVDVGPSVNTPTTLAANELRANISLRMSPFGELVVIEIVKVAVTETLPEA